MKTILTSAVALSAITIFASYPSWADTSSDASSMKAEIDRELKSCDSSINVFKCAWQDDKLEKAFRFCEKDPEDFECEAFDVKDHLPFTKSAFDKIAGDYIFDMYAKAAPLYAAIDDFEGPQKHFKTFDNLKRHIENNLKVLNRVCKANVGELRHKLDPVLKIYKAFGGTNCKGL